MVGMRRSGLMGIVLARWLIVVVDVWKLVELS